MRKISILEMEEYVNTMNAIEENHKYVQESIEGLNNEMKKEIQYDKDDEEILNKLNKIHNELDDLLASL